MLPRGVSDVSPTAAHVGHRRSENRRDNGAPFAKSSASLPLMSEMRMRADFVPEEAGEVVSRAWRCVLLAAGAPVASRCASGKAKLSWALLTEAMSREGLRVHATKSSSPERRSPSVAAGLPRCRAEAEPLQPLLPNGNIRPAFPRTGVHRWSPRRSHRLPRPPRTRPTIPTSNSPAFVGSSRSEAGGKHEGSYGRERGA